MRAREDIERSLVTNADVVSKSALVLILEVLLDIRDLLSSSFDGECSSDERGAPNYRFDGRFSAGDEPWQDESSENE